MNLFNRYREKRSLKDKIPGIDDVALDLLERLLELDPYKRLSAKKALKH